MHDSINDVLKLELIAANTMYQAGQASQTAFITLLSGSRWMIDMNAVTQVEHWDFVR